MCRMSSRDSISFLEGEVSAALFHAGLEGVIVEVFDLGFAWVWTLFLQFWRRMIDTLVVSLQFALLLRKILQQRIIHPFLLLPQIMQFLHFDQIRPSPMKDRGERIFSRELGMDIW